MMDRNLSPLKIVIYFAAFGLLWIISSDVLVAKLTKDPEIYTKLSIAKGWLYILLTSSFLYWLISLYSKQRTQSEIALRENERKYRALFEAANDGIFIQDETGFTDCNRRGAEMYGLTREQVIGRSPSEFAPERQPDRRLSSEVAGEKVRAAFSGAPQAFEWQPARADGSPFDVEVNLSRVELGGRMCLQAIVRDTSERKRAEREIAERGAMVQQIMDAACVGIGLVDKGGRFTHANRRMAEMFGCMMEELIGSEYADHVQPSERESSRQNMRTLLASAIPSMDLERRYLRKDGTEFWGRLSCRRFHDAQGNELGLIGVITDITEQKRVEESLRESKDQFRKVVEKSPLAMALVTSEGLIEYINLKAIETFGYLPQDIPNMDHWWVQAYPDKTYRDKVIAQWTGLAGEALTHNHEIEQREYRVTCKNGSVKVTAIFGVWISDRVLVVFDDITERKIAEEKLRESENKYRSLFESAKDGIFITGESGFLDCNQRGAEMYGLRREQIISRSPIELSPERQPDGRLSSAVVGEKMQAVLGGFPQVFEWQSLHANGNPFDVEITLSRLELSDKVYVQSIVRDISERKRLEQEILKSQKLESIGTLAGGLAHDFNNLLQGVFGYITMAKLTLDQREKALSMLEQAEKALHQSVNLATQLLTFSKGGKPVKEAITLGQVIENAVKFALSGSQVSARISLAGDLWPVYADAGQIAQVIQNIVLNADQSMPEGGTITIAARNMLEPKKIRPQMLSEGNYVEISIEDTGTGIPTKHLQKIFDPYFTTKEKGSGLGLATSYSIISNHGGRISVTSESGKGTNFTIYLPAIEAVKERTQKRETPLDVGKRRILVMDDEDLVLNIAGEMMRALGHDAEFAKHGKSAIEKYRAAMDSGNPFDIVILDLTIRGGLGGRDTVEQLAKIDPKVKAIVSSGCTTKIYADLSKYIFCAIIC